MHRNIVTLCVCVSLVTAKRIELSFTEIESFKNGCLAGRKWQFGLCKVM